MPEPKGKNWAHSEGYRIVGSVELAALFDKEPDAVIKVKSRIPSLDAAIQDFRDGELIVISGPTKMGKTLFAQTLTVNFIKQQYFPFWFTYEVPVRQFLSQFPEVPTFFLPERLKPHDLIWAEEMILKAYEEYRTRIVFIDHLHYLFDMARAKNASLEIGTVIRRLKTLAVSGGFIIFLLCHTTKGRSEANLSYESIRDSSFISQESDSVLMIQRRPDISENAANMRIEFHRRTGVLERVIQLVKVEGLLQERTSMKEAPCFGRECGVHG